MKALTLYQPWASLIADGRKTVETRSWGTKHRGLLAIHAGTTVDKEACKQFGYDPRTIPTGCILCIVRVVDVVQFPSDKAPPDEYGDFSPGRHGWILQPSRVLKNPLPIKGSMGLWNWNVEKKKAMF